MNRGAHARCRRWSRADAVVVAVVAAVVVAVVVAVVEVVVGGGCSVIVTNS